MFPNASERGFTLLETLVATSILITALAGVAQLFILGTHLTRQSGASGLALVAAQDKLESLRGQAFTYDPGGAPVTAPALQPSPPTTLAEDTEPYVDWLDVDGFAQESCRWRRPGSSLAHFVTRRDDTGCDCDRSLCLPPARRRRSQWRRRVSIHDSNEAAMKELGVRSGEWESGDEHRLLDHRAADRDDDHDSDRRRDRRRRASGPCGVRARACLISICSSVAELPSTSCRRHFARPETTWPRRNRSVRSANCCRPFLSQGKMSPASSPS